METMRSRPTAAPYYPPVPTVISPALRTLVVEQPEELAPYVEAWDELAAAAGRPFCAPAWMLAWWREGRRGDARLRVVLALDDADELVGVGPFFAQVGRLGLAEYRLLGAGFSHRVGLLARDGRRRVAHARRTPAVAHGRDDGCADDRARRRLRGVDGAPRAQVPQGGAAHR